MAIKYFQPSAIPESQALFNQVVLSDNRVHLASSVAADFPEGQTVPGNIPSNIPGNIGEETNAVLRLIAKILDELELKRENIVRVGVHLDNLEDFVTK